MDSKKKTIKRWFDGPSFLWDKEQYWGRDIRSNVVSEQDRKLRKMINVNVTQIENGLLSELQEKMSSWAKLKRLMAKVLVVSRVISRQINCYHF